MGCLSVSFFCSTQLRVQLNIYEIKTFAGEYRWSHSVVLLIGMQGWRNYRQIPLISTQISTVPSVRSYSFCQRSCLPGIFEKHSFVSVQFLFYVSICHICMCICVMADKIQLFSNKINNLCQHHRFGGATQAAWNHLEQNWMFRKNGSIISESQRFFGPFIGSATPKTVRKER